MIYAVGLKGYVELREAKVPPRTRETVAVKEVLEERERRHDVPNEDGAYWYTVKRLVKKRIKGIHTTGGKFVTSMKCRKFSSLTRIHILPGGVWEVPSELLPKLLGPSRRPRKEG